MKIDKKLLKELKSLRRTIHQYPELSGKEHKTRDTILDFVRNNDPDDIYMLAETGLAVVYKGKEPGPNILFRAELDALPIDEENDFSYSSRNEGISHKCGHDGHMTVVAGLSRLFYENKPQKGSITLLFQPAEEDGRGAKSIMEDPKFEKIKPDYVFAFHNLPGYSMHEIVCKENTFTAAAESIIFKMKGKTSHAAEPEKGANPAYVISEVIEKSKEFIQPDPEKDGFSLVTPVYIKVGDVAYGISAGDGDLRLTLRSFSNEIMDALKEKLVQFTQKNCDEKKIELTTEYTECFAANVNGKKAVTQIFNAAKESKLSTTKIKQPFKWAEDFGYFTTKYKGAMFGIGSGKDQPALHNPDYDFPDELIETGLKMFYSISNQILK